MTERNQKKVENLTREIKQIEAKIDKLLTQRNILANQIQKLKSEVPKEPKVPTEEDRLEQSRRDKARQLELQRANSRTIQKLELF